MPSRQTTIYVFLKSKHLCLTSYSTTKVLNMRMEDKSRRMKTDNREKDLPFLTEHILRGI